LTALLSLLYLAFTLPAPVQFDYLIVFPLTEGVYTDPLYRKGGKEYGSRIAWCDVASAWSKSESNDPAAADCDDDEDDSDDGEDDSDDDDDDCDDDRDEDDSDDADNDNDDDDIVASIC
jgi:hypothetical protein